MAFLYSLDWGVSLKSLTSAFSEENIYNHFITLLTRRTVYVLLG